MRFMRSEYRQAIQIGRNPNGILSLPCVDGVRKTFQGKLIYQVNTEYDAKARAMEGDWICQDYEGEWHVVSDDKMTKVRKIESAIIECQGIPCREVDNDKFSAELFAPLSIYHEWKTNGSIPKTDDCFKGYVPDSIFYHSTTEEFEKYVNKHFTGYDN